MKQVKVVIGANFGDEGKGLMTDFFCSGNSGVTLNVRFNGGAQAGHTVTLKDGRSHVFSHFGSGSFNNVHTYLTSDFIVNPIMFRKEFESLRKKGVNPIVFVSENARISNPYDMMINQIIEKNRSGNKHGSCGLGIFETINRYNEIGDAVTFNYIIKRLKDCGVEQISMDDLLLLTNDDIIDKYNEDVDFFNNNTTKVSDYLRLFYHQYNNIVFEGAQGLLLDCNNLAYFPHLTPSDTGLKNVVKELDSISDYELEVCYVTRSYFTRHGAGKFLTECPKEKIVGDYIDQTNKDNMFQDGLRYGHFDIDLFCDTIKKDLEHAKNVKNLKQSICVTHLNLTDGKLMTNKGEKHMYKFADRVAYFKYYLSDGKTRESVV